MKLYMLNGLVLIVLLTILPGCGKIMDWGKDNFYQGCEVENDFRVARNYIKSVRVYDQFTIVGQFDALWLSDDMRKNYVDIYCRSHSKTPEQKQVFLRRQFEENNHFVTFYVLSLNDIVLGDTDSVWSIVLKIGDKEYKPIKPPKVIDLGLEYIDIFGKKYNIFKDAYLVYFNIKDLEDNHIINESTENIALWFRSVEKEVELVWDFEQ